MIFRVPVRNGLRPSDHGDTPRSEERVSSIHCSLESLRCGIIQRHRFRAAAAVARKRLGAPMRCTNGGTVAVLNSLTQRELMSDIEFAAGWYQDPISPGDGRYWNGTAWTDAVSRSGQTITIPIDAARVNIPPVPGSEMRPSAPEEAAPAPAPVAPVSINTSQNSSAGIVIGVIVVAVVALAVLVFVLVSGGDSSNDNPPATNAPGTSAPPVTTPATSPPATDPPTTDS